jgi:putative transposase
MACMRRIKLKGPCCYHLMARLGQEVPVWKPVEQEVLRMMLRRLADFAGARIITYCVMSNHFHVLLEFPEELRAKDDAAIMERVRAYYKRASTKRLRLYALALESAYKRGGADWERMRERVRRRMGDISTFMQQLKQVFTVHINKSRGRRGTLWSERFRSVAVEGSASAVATMAAYIDLNPVRAGLVKDPKDYRFSGYGEAMGGGKAARAGLAALVSGRAWKEAQDLYRELLLGKGRVAKAHGGRIGRDVKERLGLADLVRCRVRYFTDGAVLGSAAFVKDWLSPTGRSAAYALKGGDWGGLHAHRNLRVRTVETGAACIQAD